MANILTHTGDEPILLNANALRRLLDRADSDAALLYLALLRHHGDLSPRSLTKELRWERSRTDAAETVLRELALVAPEIEQPEEESEPPETQYRQDELAFQLEDNAEFRRLTAQVESRLGKKLSPIDLSILINLSNQAGLPSDVVYTLVNHCVESYAARHGAGRLPTMKQIEKVGYEWLSRGIDTQSAAAEYLKRYARQEREYANYMRVLNLGDRLPVKREEKYLSAWLEMGFPPESVEIAYEKTVLNCQKFKWSYCNRILERWHADGLHTPAEIDKDELPAKKESGGRNYQTDEDEVGKYVQRRMKERKRKKERETEADE